MPYSYASNKKDLIVCSDGRLIPVYAGNRDYDELISSGVTILDYEKTLDEMIADIELAHATSEAALNQRLIGALLADGATQEAKLTAIRAEYVALSAKTNNAIEALLTSAIGE